MNSGVTLNELLPLDLDGLEDTVEKELRDQAEPHHSRLAWNFIKSSAADELRDALDCDVFDLLARGWGKVRELREYTDASKHPPDETSIVHFGEHKLPARVYPSLSVRIAGASCLSLKFTVEVTAEFRSVALSIRNGHIIAAAPGDARVSAQLKYGEIKLHKPEKSPRVALPGRITFTSPGLAIG